VEGGGEHHSRKVTTHAARSPLVSYLGYTAATISNSGSFSETRALRCCGSCQLDDVIWGCLQECCD
jgi:hypothetical protein